MQVKQKGSTLGVSLVLVVFILLCLITFGTLSYLLAKADNALSTSTTENVLSYYAAEFAAQTTLQEIDAQLATAYAGAEDFDSYAAALESAFAGAENISLTVDENAVILTFVTVASENETLVATLEIDYPATGGYYSITSWVLESSLV